MRRIAMAGMGTLSGLVLLFSYHTSRNESAGAATVASPIIGSTSAAAADAAGAAGAAAAAGGAAAQPSAAAAKAAAKAGSKAVTRTKVTTSGSKAYLGEAVMTRYGNVQVQIKVVAGKLTASNVTQIPWDNPKDQEINSYAVPQLNAAAVQAQGTNFDSIGGATFTSEGYKQSLQSALDKAGI